MVNVYIVLIMYESIDLDLFINTFLIAATYF